MALLAESLVEEWLNREGYFTVRGVRHGVNEIDLLAVRPIDGGLHARHIEVQVSTNPIGYLSALNAEQQARLSRERNSAARRTPEDLKTSVTEWVDKKFRSTAKQSVRDRTWPGLVWNLEFVHGEFRYGEELQLIREQGIKAIPFLDVLDALLHHRKGGYKGGAGSDIAEILAYHRRGRGPAA